MLQQLKGRPLLAGFLYPAGTAALAALLHPLEAIVPVFLLTSG